MCLCIYDNTTKVLCVCFKWMLLNITGNDTLKTNPCYELWKTIVAFYNSLFFVLMNQTDFYLAILTTS